MRSYMVVGNQTLTSPELATAIGDLMAGGPTELHVVVPATPAQKGFTWDENEAIAVARERLDEFLQRLKAMGLKATGEVGARAPIEALPDALRSPIGADEDPNRTPAVSPCFCQPGTTPAISLVTGWKMVVLPRS